MKQKLLHSKGNHSKDNPQSGRKYLQRSNWQQISLQNLQAAHVAQYQK